MTIDVVNAENKKVGSVELKDEVFGGRVKTDLIHESVVRANAAERRGTHATKNRALVSGSGKKPWRQKGTGRARHGSIRSPIWKGGGVTHGPRNEKNYERTIPKKMRAKALYMALSKKLQDGEIVFVDSFKLETPKTAAAKKALDLIAKSGFEKITTKRKNAALVAFSDPTEATKKSFRNIGNIATVAVRDLNPVSVLGNTYLVIENPEAAVKIVESRTAKKN